MSDDIAQTFKKEDEIRAEIETSLNQTLEEGKNAPPIQEDITEVKTISQMAVESGQPIPPPMDQEKFIGQLLLSHHMGSQVASQAFTKLSKNAMIRVFKAVLQMPQGGLKVALKTTLEKEVFMAAQKCLMEKHTIIFDRVKSEVMAERKAKEAREAALAEQTNNQGEANNGSTTNV